MKRYFGRWYVKVFGGWIYAGSMETAFRVLEIATCKA